jgi:predicted ATPase
MLDQSIVRVHVRNFRSISQATVDLPPFCVLVGQNGAGKSNFVDALAFVRDCLADSVELAFKGRGGIRVVRRISGGHPTHIGIRIEMQLAPGTYADYAFELAARSAERFEVARERCVVSVPMGGIRRFDRERGELVHDIPGLRSKIFPDRLALFAASATEEFRPVFDFLTAMRFVSIDPERLRDLQQPDAGEFLKKDGSNAAAVLKRIRDEFPDRYERIRELLGKAIPGIRAVDYKAVGQRESLEFKQDVGLDYPWTFPAANMSDGTLRLLGLLLALNQPGDARVIAIEEPEATVHPAITELLMQVLMATAKDRQVVVTTHSPDVIDYKSLSEDAIRVVTKRHNETLISRLAKASHDAVRKHLYTPGELLRIDELIADERQAQSLARQTTLFGPVVIDSQ